VNILRGRVWHSGLPDFGTVHLLVYQRTRRLGELDVSVLGWGGEWHLPLFGPLENANISHYISPTLLALINRLFSVLKFTVSETRLFVYFYKHGRTQSQGSAWRSWSPSLGVGYEAQCHISRLVKGLMFLREGPTWCIRSTKLKLTSERGCIVRKEALVSHCADRLLLRTYSSEKQQRSLLLLKV
jgi:hypothetical protein